MKEFEVFFPATVLEYLANLPSREAKLVMRVILDLGRGPEIMSHRVVIDERGRMIDVHVVGKQQSTIGQIPQINT